MTEEKRVVFASWFNTNVTERLNPILQSRKKHMIEHKYLYIYFSIIFLVFCLTRLIRITTVPNGMHIDEISMGYNVWSLAQFGKDRYNVSFPVYFNNAGSGQSSLYVYTAVILSKVFGYSLFLLRFVSVLFGLILLIFSTKSAYEMFGIKAACATAAIVDIMPVFLMSERWAFDCNAMLPMMSIVLYCSIKLLKTNRTKYAVLLGVSSGLTLYSYILAFMMLPVFLLCYIIYGLVKKSLSFKKIGIAALSGFIVSVPILLYMMVVLDVLSPFSIGPISITDASAQRISELFWQNLNFKEIMSRLASITSYDRYEFMANEEFGVFYSNTLVFYGHEINLSQILLLIAFVILLTSLVKRIKSHSTEINWELLLIAYIVAVLYPTLFLRDLAIYRFNAVYLAFAILFGYLLSFMWEHNQRILSCMIAVIFAFNFGSYMFYVFGDGMNSTVSSIPYFDNDLLTLCETFDDFSNEGRQIYIDDTASYNAGLISLYGLRVTPDEVAKIESVDDEEMTYGNLHIGIPHQIDINQKAVYVIRDVNSESSQYYTPGTQLYDLEKKMVTINKVKQILLRMGVPCYYQNNYYIFELN